jgi:hypothetical protein
MVERSRFAGAPRQRRIRVTVRSDRPGRAVPPDSNDRASSRNDRSSLPGPSAGSRDSPVPARDRQASGGRAPPEPGTAQRSGERHPGRHARLPPHHARRPPGCGSDRRPSRVRVERDGVVQRAVRRTAAVWGLADRERRAGSVREAPGRVRAAPPGGARCGALVELRVGCHGRASMVAGGPCLSSALGWRRLDRGAIRARTAAAPATLRAIFRPRKDHQGLL